jgi:hypothetical protein
MNTKSVSILLFILLINFQLIAQDTLSVNCHRLSLKISGALVNGTPHMAGNQVLFVELQPQVGLSIIYQFLENLNTGIGVSYFNPHRAIPHQEGYSTNYEATKSSVWYYGFNVSYNILPVLLHSNRIRFDIYPIVSVTHVREKWLALDSGIPGSATFWEYNGGIGLGYNFNQHLSLFSETMFGRFYNEDKIQFKGGLKISF